MAPQAAECEGQRHKGQTTAEQRATGRKEVGGGEDRGDVLDCEHR